MSADSESKSSLSQLYLNSPIKNHKQSLGDTYEKVHKNERNFDRIESTSNRTSKFKNMNQFA